MIQAISVLHDLGLSVSPSALHRKKKDIVLQQEEIIKDTVGKYVDQRKEIMTATEIIKDYEEIQDFMQLPVQPEKEFLNNRTDLSPELLSNGCGAHLKNAFITVDLWDSSNKVFPSAKADTDVTFSMNFTFHPVTSAGQKPETVLFNIRENKKSNTGIIYSSGMQEKIVSFSKEKILKAKEYPCVPIEILGDNVDILVSPANMNLDRQRKSWHWFLLLATQKRITDESLPTDKPIADIETMSSCEFLPSQTGIIDFQKNMQFHVARILTKYIDELKPLEILLPNYIQHPHTAKTSQKPVFINSDLIDESENSSDGMIRIMQRVHSLAVPYIDGNIEKVVLGGDVLTNERAMSAQLAMSNNESSFEKLLGVIHRPEGLHRQMNFLMV